MKTEYRQINKQTTKELCKNLENENWLDLYNIADTQEAYHLFYNRLHNAYEKSIPLKKANNVENRRIPWLTKGILISKKNKKEIIKEIFK